MQKKLMGAVAVAAVAALAASSAAMAGPPASKGSKARQATVVQPGVQVAIDPATGRVRAPTAAERQALANTRMTSSRSTGSVAGQRPRNESEALSTLRVHRKGRINMSVQVPENQFNYLTAQRNADGSISIRHEGDADHDAAPQEVTQ
ncbi:post-PEP-CTERM-1 domain-containing protein [Luteimonas soli]|uniref:Post-PEP-CTERM-1 domain-containing protein n=1 Tax=Luteimonas soli TaxID=1648966 RepID=A0ABV7XGC3_9GAMM